MSKYLLHLNKNKTSLLIFSHPVFISGLIRLHSHSPLSSGDQEIVLHAFIFPFQSSLICFSWLLRFSDQFLIFVLLSHSESKVIKDFPLPPLKNYVTFYSLWTLSSPLPFLNLCLKTNHFIAALKSSWLSWLHDWFGQHLFLHIEFT